jgi:glycosyltransferase involved in cell wall biosynthesis
LMRACMVAYTSYESDNRVRRYAETLGKHGYQVDAIALKQDGESSRDVVEGVRVHRIQRRVPNEKSRLDYISRLLLFFTRSMTLLTREHLKRPYDLIHVHSVPDFEVFAALFPKLMGAKVILDIHDIVPEFYASKFHSSHDSLSFKLLVAVERMSSAFSDHVIAANHIWEQRLCQRSTSSGKCTTILNYPDTAIFRPRGKNRTDGKFIILYPGTLNYHQGLDIGIRAFSLIKDRVPNAEFHIYGRGEQLEALKTLINELDLNHRVFLRGIVSTEEISAIMENADLGVVPKRKDSFGNEAFSTKILEFMCLGVPMVIPDTMIDRYYFNDSVAKFFTANDENSLAEAMLFLIQNPEHRKSLVANASEFVKKYAWSVNEEGYLSLVTALLKPSNGQPDHTGNNGTGRTAGRGMSARDSSAPLLRTSTPLH